MKRKLFSFCFVALALFSFAQTSSYQRIKNLIQVYHPELNLENKLIAYNLWSVDDAESREANKAFEKTYSVYQNARLKGGLRGIVVLAINKDNLSSEAVITVTKDGVSKLIQVKWEEIEGLDEKTANVVFDSNGNEVYKNLGSQAIYSSINHLITR